MIYFNERYWDPNSRVRAGGTLHFQQPIFTLPDLNQMKVKLKVHESVVKKVSPGLAATMQVEAMSKQVLHGKVLTVASVAQNDEWRGGGVKEYLTEVGYSTHYHAIYVYPHWAPRMKKNTKIGMHVFYQFKRGWKFG